MAHSALLGRRAFTAFLAGAGVFVPHAALAQRSGRPATIGFLGATNAAAARLWVEAFEKRLAELGWVPGQTIAVDYRWADGRAERYAEIAAEFAAMKADIIVTFNTPAILAAKKATSTIPIVFALGANPVGTGIVESLARPGGNVTGLATTHADLIGKRIELLLEISPKIRRIAILANVGNAASVGEMREVAAAAPAFGIEAVMLGIRSADEIEARLNEAASEAQGLYAVADALTNNERRRINTLALSARQATMFGAREWVAAGGLMSYGANFVDLFRRSAEYVNKILRGARPQDLPVEQPIRFDLVINQATAKDLGLTVPQSLLTRADEVIG